MASVIATTELPAGAPAQLDEDGSGEPRRRRRLRVRRSLTVNAVSLLVATLATNAFGLIFWGVAAHLRSPAVVGRASAAVAALTLLATVSQLNLTNVFVRLLPAAGGLGRRFISRGYLVVVILALLVGIVYAASGLGSGVLSGSWAGRALFAVAVPVMAIFALEDSVLTALRLSPWVPLENVSCAIAKLALLPALVLLSSTGGIVTAWVIPASVAVLVVNRLLFTRAIPRAEVAGTLPGRRRLLSFVAGEYVGNIFSTATVQVMPLIIVARLGPSAAAFFTIPWLISMGITLLLWNVASSFVVEVASGQGPSRQLLRRSLLLWAGLSVAAIVVCLLGAGPILSLAGARYAGRGTELLRLIGLSTPFGAVIAMYSTLIWLDQRVWTLAAYAAAQGASIVGLTLILLPRLGLTAVGWANLSIQAAAALAAVRLIAIRTRRRRTEVTP